MAKDPLSYLSSKACGSGNMLLSILLLLAGLVHAPPPNHNGSSALVPRDTTFENFKFIDCNTEEQDIIEESFSHVRDMLDIQRDSLTDVQDYLVGVLNDQKPRMTHELQNKMASFMMFYGEFDYSDHCEISENIDKTEQVVDAVRRIDKIMSEFAFSGTYAPTIFCTDEFFEYDRTEGENNYYKNIQDVQQREVMSSFGDETGVCGDATVAAAMLYPLTGRVEDWMIICPFLIEKWLETKSGSDLGLDLRYLSDYRALPLESLLGRNINDIMLGTPEAWILHELSHSGIIFNLFDVDHNGNQKEGLIMLDDMEVAPGQPAYEFRGVAALARVSRNDPSKMVRNADTLAYHAGAVYLSQCNWAPDGVCKAP